MFNQLLTSVHSGLGASIARLYYYITDQGALFWATHDFEVMYTQIIYVQMLESGVCITAVNIPCLWGLFTGKLPEFTVKMLRSLTSLTSLDNIKPSTRRHGSQGSDRTAAVQTVRVTDGAPREPWSQPLGHRGDIESQSFGGAYATHTPGNGIIRKDPALESNAIRVDRSFEVK